MFYPLTNTMYSRLNIAISSCKLLPLTLSRLGVYMNYNEIRKHEESISKAFLEQLIITINKSYEIGIDDFVTSPKKCQMIDDLFVSETQKLELYEWRMNPVNLFNDEREDKISFYISLFIRKNNIVLASLLYDLSNDIFYTAIKGHGARIENKNLRTTNIISNDPKFICDDENISDQIIKSMKSVKLQTLSILDGIISLAEEEVDFLIFINYDIDELQSEILILKESKAMMKICKLNSKKVLVAAKPKIFQKVVSIIEC